jgi:hypothetical protein
MATLLPDPALYREEQTFDWRVYAAIAVVEGLTGLGLTRGQIWSLDFALGLIIGLVLLVLLVVFLLYMTTEVVPNGIRVAFGWWPTYQRMIAIDNIASVEVVTYRPISEFGFWGICTSRDGVKAFIARGNRGVRMELADGSRVLIGSQRPEILALALQQLLRPGE